MKEFEPSPDFVVRVMSEVRTEVDTRTVSEPIFTLTGPLRWWLALGGGLMTLINLFRMMGSVFAPALCG